MSLDGTLPPLHALESEVMEELWARSEATVREVQEALNARGGKVRAYTTLLTVMTRLDGKGLLVRRRAGRLDVYAPALSRDAYLQRVPSPRSPRSSRTSATSRSRTSRATSAGSTRSGWRSSAGWRMATDLRRAEFAVASFGVTAFLLALIFALDAVRFHGDVLVAARGALPRGEVHVRGVLLISLVLFDLYASCARWARSGAAPPRTGGSRRRCRCWTAPDRGRRVLVIPGAQPLAFCAGLLRPRVYVSTGALERLGEAELAAVVAHEAHHAARRDPLRLLVARAIGDAYSLGALPRREQALAELAATPPSCAVAAWRRWRRRCWPSTRPRSLPERVDRLTGEAPRDEVPRAFVAGAGAVIAALVALLALGLLVDGHPPVCLPLASAPSVAVRGHGAARGDGPAWLGWRRAGAFLASPSP